MVKQNIVIENARIGFRNFSGVEEKFNPAGRRNFCVFLETELAEDLEKDGWNIKWLAAREEGDEDQGYMQVAINYANIPPKIVMVSSGGKTIMREDTVSLLDWAEIENVDIIINPYNWEVNGKTGVKAYVKSMYVTIIEDEFAEKYADIPNNSEGPAVDELEDDEEVPF